MNDIATYRLDAKPCTGCKVEKPLDDFGKNKACRDGRKSRCRQCEREWAAEWRKENPGRARGNWRRYALSHPERLKEKQRRWRDLNKAHIAKTDGVRVAAWVRENPDRAKANRARHRAAKLRAAPAWADRDEIAAIYKASIALGPDFHVDHIIPLQGRTVCGLHCEANLQIIPASVNISKHNRRWPDMWGVQ